MGPQLSLYALLSSSDLSAQIGEEGPTIAAEFRGPSCTDRSPSSAFGFDDGPRLPVLHRHPRDVSQRGSPSPRSITLVSPRVRHTRVVTHALEIRGSYCTAGSPSSELGIDDCLHLPFLGAAVAVCRQWDCRIAAAGPQPPPRPRVMLGLGMSWPHVRRCSWRACDRMRPTAAAGVSHRSLTFGATRGGRDPGLFGARSATRLAVEGMGPSEDML